VPAASFAIAAFLLGTLTLIVVLWPADPPITKDRNLMHGYPIAAGGPRHHRYAAGHYHKLPRLQGSCSRCAFLLTVGVTVCWTPSPPG